MKRAADEVSLIRRSHMKAHGKITTIGLDIAKSVLQAHGIDAAGQVVVRQQLKRARVIPFFAKLAPCTVGIEACASSHHWARELTALGHTVKLMPPAYVKPFLKRQKNDAADAEAICEAVQRPSTRFVPVKTPDQQAAMLLHRTRHLYVRQMTAVINALRAHLAEFGIVAPQGRGGVEQLVAVIKDRKDDRDLCSIVATARRRGGGGVGASTARARPPPPPPRPPRPPRNPSRPRPGLIRQNGVSSYDPKCNESEPIPAGNPECLLDLVRTIRYRESVRQSKDWRQLASTGPARPTADTDKLLSVTAVMRAIMQIAGIGRRSVDQMFERPMLQGQS
jgi:transposase